MGLNKAFFLTRSRDPHAWVCLIGLLAISGLMAGAFEPAEPDRIQDAGIGDGLVEVALSSPALPNQPG